MLVVDQVLDLSRPVAVLLIAVLHFIADADDPYAIVARLMDAVPPGSYLVMAHGASDIAPEAAPEMARRYNDMSSAPITLRHRDQVARFFDGLGLLLPGLVPISQRPMSRWSSACSRERSPKPSMRGARAVRTPGKNWLMWRSTCWVSPR